MWTRNRIVFLTVVETIAVIQVFKINGYLDWGAIFETWHCSLSVQLACHEEKFGHLFDMLRGSDTLIAGILVGRDKIAIN